MLAMLGMAIFASFASFWPYNLTPGLRHYVQASLTAKSAGFINNLKMAAGTFFGTLLVFFGAYLLEDRTRTCAARYAHARNAADGGTGPEVLAWRASWFQRQTTFTVHQTTVVDAVYDHPLLHHRSPDRP